MEETILCPSPNWFLPSVLSVSGDGWLVYGGPGRCLVVLEPLPSEFEGVIDSTHRHKAHVVHRSHNDKVSTVDISPDWPEKRHFVTGSPDGAVKEWTITKVDKKWSIKNIQSHEAHDVENEEVIGVGYSKPTTTATHVISVGSFSNVVLWELNTNTTKTYGGFMRHFKASCMSCSPHMPLVVAVGTKQGVVFVLDLNGKGNIVYKVRGQDDDISQVTWCPQYEVVLKRSFQEKKSLATKRLEQIRNEPEPSSLDTSGAEKKLPDDSFDDSITAPEDDMFDIYKDHEVNEFGHKKYQPEEIMVKEKVDSEKEDFLAECQRLKNQILKNKQEDDQSIASLVEAMDKTHVNASNNNNSQDGKSKEISGIATLAASSSKIVQVDGTDHVHKHLLASISKNGFSVRIWSKTGKIVASCAVQLTPKQNNKNQAHKTPHSASLHWYKADMLLIVDSKTHLLGCNPLNVDCRNRIQWSVLHTEHRRGLFFVTSNSPRVQTPEVPLDESRWSVWTVGQDRYLIKYDVSTHQVLAKFGTCGGYLYNVTPCSYDAGKLAIGVGDGAVRIWETQPTGEEENKLTMGEVAMHWQNVQGKILQCAWHPTKENLLAFSTAESRVGILDISKGERPAKVLQPGLSNGVYSLAWGEGMTLFAVGGKDLVMYKANKPEMAPVPIRIEIEGQVWDMSVVEFSTRGLTVASTTGGVAVFSGTGGHALAAKFVFTRQIQAISWHPQQTTFSDEQSEYKDLLAITSVERTNTVVVIKYEDKEGGGKQFTDFRTLVGHMDKVTQAFWSPHREGMLLSSSLDSTIRVWDVAVGACVSVFDGHSSGTLGAAWCALPQLSNKVISGGNDFCLRLWDVNDYPAENYTEVKKERVKRANKKKGKGTNRSADGQNAEDDKQQEDGKKDTDLKQKDVNDKDRDTNETDHSDVDTGAEVAVKINKVKEGKRYILPLVSRQIYNINVDGIRVMLQKQLDKSKDIKTLIETAKQKNPELHNVDYLKLFGTINEVNEVLDMECESHLALKSYKEYVMLMIFRGRIDSVIQFATERDLLDPFLVSIAPCVSFKYWKDVTQLYIAQIDRLAVKKPEDNEPGLGGREYGALYRKVAALLSIHDVRGAVDMLEDVNLYKEAYILCRCRHMDSIAEQVLRKWTGTLAYTGNLMCAALIYISMGEVSNAATVLRRSTGQEHLNFAAELAKTVGLNTFADYIETKVKNAEKETKSNIEDKTEELLKELPTKMELLLKDVKDQNGALNAPDVVENGENKDVVENGKNKDIVENGKNKDVVENGKNKDVVENGKNKDVVGNGENNSASEIVTETKE